MIRFAADENFHRAIVSGLLRRQPHLDLVRIQDVGLSGQTDPKILGWCAEQGRVLITHDVNTVSAFAFERVAAGLSMPGVIQVVRAVQIGRAIDELLLLAECSRDGEWEGQVVYLPLD